jgi:hypothetical protein
MISFILAELPYRLVIIAFNKIKICNRIEGDNTLSATIFLSFFCQEES